MLSRKPYELESKLEKFLAEYPPDDHDIIAACIGPAPSQYDLWGKPYNTINEWGLHIHVNYSDPDLTKLPANYDSVPVVIFYNLEEG